MNRKKTIVNAKHRFAGSLCALTSGLAIAVVVSNPLSAQVVPPAGATVTVTTGNPIQETTASAITVPSASTGVTIDNNAGGVISSAAASAIETSADTTINNSGTASGGFNGVNFVNGAGSGVLNNSATGSITSDSRGVNIGGSVQLTNQGSILGTGDQRNGTVYSDSVANNFSIDNSGTIDAGAGNQGSGIGLEIGPTTTASVTNSGLIQGRTNTPGVAGNSGLSGDGLRLNNFGAPGVFDGTIDNTATGEIRSESQSGTIAGLRIAEGIGFQGDLDNAGLIDGTQNGVYFGQADHTGGVVNNSGTITSDSRALNIDGEGLEVNNSGDILGTGNQRNGTVYADGTADDFTFNNQTGGVVDAGAGNTGSGFGAEVGGAADGANTFSLTNDGTIAGRGSAPSSTSAAGDGVRIGNPTNTGVADGSIVNNGTITSESTDGTTAGIRAVDGVGFQGTLDNAGDISGAQNGVYFGDADHTGGVVNNSGTITSDSRALNIDGEGLEVNNSGDILGTGNQRNGTVYADGTADDFTFNNQSGGVIDAGAGNTGSGFGAEVGGAADGANTFSLTNSGTIAGRGSASAATNAAGDGVRIGNPGNAGVADGSIVNNGTITSESTNGTTAGIRAVDGVGFQGTLDNVGLISGVQNGVYFGDADHTGGVVNNSGTISSDSRAFNIDGEGLLLNNTGNIFATGSQRNGTVYADGTSNNFTINNSGSIDATGGAGSGVSVEVGSFTGDVQNGLINNSGLIAGSGTGPLDAGVRLFSGAPNTAFSGDINNSFGGTITGGDLAAAVLIDSSVQFDGDLNNSGIIDGSIFLSDGDLVLGSTSELFLEVSSLTDFEVFETTGDFFADGTLNISFDNFTPTVGQTFDIFDFNVASGAFGSIVSDGFLLDTSDLLAGGSFTVSAAVPEPGSLVVLSVVGLMFAGRRRRTR